jgi:DNA polymerase-3 subunit gamma/tau
LQADDDALELVARRAGGSMRDAQSLLDQLLAFGGDRLTVAQVHGLLGTADDERVAALAAAVLAHDSKQTLALLGQAADEGLQLGELLDQLIAYWRDLMVVNCAGPDGQTLNVGPQHREALLQQAAALKLDTILAGLDILATTKARLPRSNHGRVLLEMALVRLGRLDDLVSLAQVAQWLSQPQAARPAPAATPARPAPTALPPEAGKKKPVAAAETAAATPSPLTAESLPQVWQQVLAQVGGMLAGALGKAELLAISGPNTLAVRFDPRYNDHREQCQEPRAVARIEDTLRRLTGQSWSVRIDSGVGAVDQAAPSVRAAEETETSLVRMRRQRDEAMQTPLLKRALDLMGAQIVRMDEGFGAAPAGTTAADETAETEEP